MIEFFEQFIARVGLANFLAQIGVSVFSLASVWEVGSGRKTRGWNLLITGHSLFLVYSALTDQWGFWLLNVGMTTIAMRNLMRDRRKDERLASTKSEV